MSALHYRGFHQYAGEALWSLESRQKTHKVLIELHATNAADFSVAGQVLPTY
jgi:hypothetical protein